MSGGKGIGGRWQCGGGRGWSEGGCGELKGVQILGESGEWYMLKETVDAGVKGEVRRGRVVCVVGCEVDG